MSWGILIKSDDGSCPKTRAVINEYHFIYPGYFQNITFAKGNMLVDTWYKEEKPIKLKIETPDIHDYYHVIFNMMQELWKIYPDLKDEEKYKAHRASIREWVRYKLTPIFDWDTLSEFIVPADLGFMEKMEFLIGAYNKNRMRIVKEIHGKP